MPERAVRLPFYHVDAFTREPFGGNPAAVFPLDGWLEERTLAAIAAEMNLPATAFFVAQGDDFGIRWFSPAAELELCGHATLASGYVLLNGLEPEREAAVFHARAGRLEVRRQNGRLALDFPALPPQRQHDPQRAAGAIGIRPLELWEAPGIRGLAVLADAAQVRELHPAADAVEDLPFSALIVTARGARDDCDFVSRFFAPKHGIVEDFATGSAHCVLAPYWARVLGKSALFARQLSSRGGALWVEARGERVQIAGECAAVAEGTLAIASGRLPA
jgi:PhzF family phenazine biosynthesis protein